MYVYIYITYIRDMAEWMHYIYIYLYRAICWYEQRDANNWAGSAALFSIAHDDGVLELLLWRMRSRLPEHQRRWTRSAPVQSADTLDAWAWCQLEWSTSTVEPLSRRRVVDRLDKDRRFGSHQGPDEVKLLFQNPQQACLWWKLRQRMNTPRRLCEPSGGYVRDGSC